MGSGSKFVILISIDAVNDAFYGEIFLIDGNYLSVTHVENVATYRRTLALTPKHHPAVDLAWVLWSIISTITCKPIGILLKQIHDS